MILNVLLIFSLWLPLSACKQEEVYIEAPQSIHSLSVVTKNNEVRNFQVELALTPEDQQKGLMNRAHLRDDSGMLFYFNESRQQSFWMKNTLIPLDLIFIKEDGTIHRIHRNAIPHDLSPIGSQGEVRAVLEINGGMADKMGIRKGDVVKHSFFE